MSTHRKSTIVRASQTAILRLVRASFRTLELFAPGLASRWATRIWCTPPHGRRGRHRDPEGTPGERFMVPITTRGMVVAETWGAGPVTYLLHGWGGRRGQLAAFVAPLVAAGQRVVALDAPGHGESGAGRLGGRRTHLPEIAEALAAVIAVTGPAHAIIAHSGGALATTVAVHDGLAAGRLVFIAPMTSPLPYLRRFADQLSLGRRSFDRFVRRAERLVGRDFADFDAVARAAAAEPGRLPPRLVIHDRDDREVSHAGGRALAEAWARATPGTSSPTPGATLHTTHGLGHRRLLSDPAVIAETVSFITAGSATLTGATAAGSTPHS
jgi:pimeloyl-ACP methyl ester carboxylesterase